VEALAASDPFARAIEPDAHADDNSENEEFSHTFSILFYWVSMADIED
jgi:hypothetical protein